MSSYYLMVEDKVVSVSTKCSLCFNNIVKDSEIKILKISNMESYYVAAFCCDICLSRWIISRLAIYATIENLYSVSKQAAEELKVPIDSEILN